MQYWAVEQRGEKMLSALAACNVRHAHLVRCLFGKTRSRHPAPPMRGCDAACPQAPAGAAAVWAGRPLMRAAADTSEPPNASPIPHHRSGFDRRAAYEFPCSAPALANADDPNMDDQPKTRLTCRRCAARMKLARQLPWLDHSLPAVLLFQCIDCGHVDMVEWPESDGRGAVKRPRITLPGPPTTHPAELRGSHCGSWYSTRTLPWKISHADKPFSRALCRAPVSVSNPPWETPANKSMR